MNTSVLKLIASTALLLVSLASPVRAGEISNPGFESEWEAWMEIDKDGKSAAISGDSHEGKKSAKLTSTSGSFGQLIDVEPDTDYVLSAWVKGSGIVGVKMGQQLVYERQDKAKSWEKVDVAFNSGQFQKVAIFAQFNGKKSLFDDFTIIAAKGEQDAVIRLGTGGLSPDFPPGRNFDLNDWYLNTPESGANGRSKRISERQLVQGYEDSDYFYTGEDGGMVFRATVSGSKTSKNTRYTRTELREMLRRGDTSISTRNEDKSPNKNNWVFSSAPRKARKAAGGVDGTLKATLAVNHVTTTGEAHDIGRVIIGQIHASSDEPIRLHYRKLPYNERGSIYAAHEISGGDDQWYEILGSRSDTATNPVDGIALNEKFSYEIVVKGNELKVSISKKGVLIGSTVIDMSNSGYDVAKDYMYFKAGVYNQNNSGEPDDYDQATFYSLENSHQGYEY